MEKNKNVKRSQLSDNKSNQISNHFTHKGESDTKRKNVKQNKSINRFEQVNIQEIEYTDEEMID